MEYIELHCHSYFSLLDGASSPEALVERAKTLGYPALALTDHHGLYGIMRFWQATRELGLKAIVGAEISLTGDGPDSTPWSQGKGHLTLLAETRQGYANLCRLLSTGQLARPEQSRRTGGKGRPSLTMATLADHAPGLLCLSGCRQGAISKALQLQDDQARHIAAQFRDIWGPDRFWIELQHHYLPTDTGLVAALLSLAKEMDIGIVATNNVHYARRSGQQLGDVLACIRHHTTLPQALAGGLLHPNSEQFLKSPQEMADFFAGLPGALENTLHIAERCNVCLDFSDQRLPAFPVPQGHSPASYLLALCELGLRDKLDPASPQAKTQLAHELGVIERLGLSGYFLVVWDIVRFARQQGIRCQGRGSAANSLVAYLLGITPIDPLRHNLLFERFLSEEARTMPDIDVDFAADRREEVIQYVYERYGQEHVGMVCNVVTYRARSALRDVAKALAFPPNVIDQAAKSLDTRSATQAAEDLSAIAPLPQQKEKEPSEGEPSEGEPSESVPWHLLADLLRQIDGLPRHLSIHVGGMLITAAPLVELVPLERAAMPGRVVVQWNKDCVEDAGLIKIDLLCLRTLSVIDEALRHIKEQRGLTFEPSRLPLDDPAVYDLLQRADTIGCFQVESRAQAQMLPKLQPTRFEDIVVGVALIRPGPIQGGMVHPYLRRRQGLEEPAYAHPSLEPALAETLGVIVFQEQVIRVAMAVAGFSPAQADRLRRAMSRSRSGQAMAALREHFVDGAQANGVDAATAMEVWQQLAGFAGFGFCKSHAAAFALVAYQTLYLKAYFPAEYYCALLNHQPMGFYPPEVLVGDARRHGVPVLHPDLNRSLEACTLEGVPAPSPAPCSAAEREDLAIRLGLRYVHGLGEAWQERIVECRGDRPFQSLSGFCRRARIPQSLIENLIRAGALDSLGCPRSDQDKVRRDLLWELGGLAYQEEDLDLNAPVMPVDLPALSPAERLAWEYELMGLAPGDQVMSLYREALRARGVVTSRELNTRRDGEVVRVAGWPVVRQRPPTAKGVLFVTLEDETGLINLIVRPQVYEQYRTALRNAPLLWAEGRLQREGLALSVLVNRAAALGGPR